MKVPQFNYRHYKKLLEEIVSDTNNKNYCSTETLLIIRHILYDTYPYQTDDIEYLLDMTNYYMRKINYVGRKTYVIISKYLDELCSTELYVLSYIQIEKQAVS